MHARALVAHPDFDAEAIPYRKLNAWFAVGRAKDVGRKRPITVQLFGRDIVVFRDAESELQALDAICPHLGAHLGGGRVVEGSIECPFHRWRFGGDGDCEHVPFARKIPPKARLGCWPITQRAGLIFIWHHAEKAPPSYELPDIEAEFGDLKSAAYFQLEGSSTVQDMNENGLDVLHFPTIHRVRMGSGFDGHPAVQNLTVDGWRLRYELRAEGKVMGRDRGLSLKFDVLGPTAFVSRAQSPTPFDVLAFHQPVDTRRIKSHFLVMPRTRWAAANAILRPFVAMRTRSEVRHDLVVWNDQRHAARPVLSDADGPVMAYRKWMRQFYA